MRQCICCGEVFDDKSSDSELCSMKCTLLFCNPKYNRDVVQFRAHAQLQTCPTCNNQFWWTTTPTRRRKYCSDACAAIAKRESRRK